MKKAFIFLASAALLYNIISLVIWLYSYSKANSQEKASAMFSDYIVAGMSIGSWYILSIAATILSIVVFTRYKGSQQYNVFNSLIIVQAAFLFLFIWQLL